MSKIGKILGKRQLVLAVMVVALGAAVYLNYQFSLDTPAADTGAKTSATGDKNLGDSQYVNSPSTQTTAPGSDNPDDYFVKARASREEAREEALDIVKDLVGDAAGDSALQKEALEKAAAIAAAVEQESKIESLISAKGFDGCIAFIEGEKCNIVVRAGEISAAQILQITEIVTAQSQVIAKNVNVMTVD